MREPTFRATDEITIEVVKHLLINKVDHDIIRGVIEIMTKERPWHPENQPQYFDPDIFKGNFTS